MWQSNTARSKGTGHVRRVCPDPEVAAAIILRLWAVLFCTYGNAKMSIGSCDIPVTNCHQVRSSLCGTVSADLTCCMPCYCCTLGQHFGAEACVFILRNSDLFSTQYIHQCKLLKSKHPCQGLPHSKVDFSSKFLQSCVQFSTASGQEVLRKEAGYFFLYLQSVLYLLEHQDRK